MKKEFTQKHVFIIDGFPVYQYPTCNDDEGYINITSKWKKSPDSDVGVPTSHNPTLTF